MVNGDPAVAPTVATALPKPTARLRVEPPFGHKTSDERVVFACGSPTHGACGLGWQFGSQGHGRARRKGGIAMNTLIVITAFACSFRICWLIVTSGEH